MKKDTHPTINPVIFVDTSCGAEFVTTSTLSSKETRDIDGVSHFVINIEISSQSHPFYTGEHRFVDTAGRVDKFKEKLERVAKAAEGRKGKKAKKAARDAKNAVEEAPKKSAKGGSASGGKATKATKAEETPVVVAPAVAETPEVKTEKVDEAK